MKSIPGCEEATEGDTEEWTEQMNSVNFLEIIKMFVVVKEHEKKMKSIQRMKGLAITDI